MIQLDNPVRVWRLTVRLTLEERAAIKRQADRDGVSMSDVAREALQSFFDDQDQGVPCEAA